LLTFISLLCITRSKKLYYLLMC